MNYFQKTDTLSTTFGVRLITEGCAQVTRAERIEELGILQEEDSKRVKRWGQPASATREAAGTNLAPSRSPHDVLLENFAVLRKVGSSSLTGEDGLGWKRDGWTERLRPPTRRVEISIIQVQGRE